MGLGFTGAKGDHGEPGPPGPPGTPAVGNSVRGKGETAVGPPGEKGDRGMKVGYCHKTLCYHFEGSELRICVREMPLDWHFDFERTVIQKMEYIMYIFYYVAFRALIKQWI